MGTNTYPLYDGDNGAIFMLTRDQLQNLYVNGLLDGYDDEQSRTETFDAIQELRGCPHWPNRCEDCPMCGGDGITPPTRYNSSL